MSRIEAKRFLIGTALVSGLAFHSPMAAGGDEPSNALRLLPPVVAARKKDGSVRRVQDSPPALPEPSPANSSGPVDPGSQLVPGQTIEPIDLAAVLRLAGARDLDIAIARERVCQSVAELEQARALWLPSIFIGPNWIRHDGQVQQVDGRIISTSKSSLFLGATAAGGGSVSGPIPAGGPAPVSAFSTIFRISDAIFQPLAAQRVVAARGAGLQAATNDAILQAAEAFLDLQLAAGRLAAAREGAENAGVLAQLTGSYARTGAGLDADHQRSLAERGRQRKNIEAAVGQLEESSAELIRLLHLDPRLVVAPIEPPTTLIRYIPPEVPLDDLIVEALTNRPELAEAQALVQATLLRLREAKLRPLIPSVAFRYSGGGFGGGVNSFFGGFGPRSDADANLYWELTNLGFGDRAVARNRAAQQRTAALELLKVQDRVASDVVRAHKAAIASARQVEETSRVLPQAEESFTLNLNRIRRSSGLPIEVLQPIQALAQARLDHLDAVLAFNRAQFRLQRAIGKR